MTLHIIKKDIMDVKVRSIGRKQLRRIMRVKSARRSEIMKERWAKMSEDERDTRLNKLKHSRKRRSPGEERENSEGGVEETKENS